MARGKKCFGTSPMTNAEKQKRKRNKRKVQEAICPLEAQKVRDNTRKQLQRAKDRAVIATLQRTQVLLA